jgi:glutathione synthase/RimK-type ligase-like ATP-grasp enzyme
MDTILLLTHSGDFYTIDNVEAHLKNMGFATLRLNTDLYPSELHLDFYRENQNGIRKVITINGNDIDTASIKGIWFRRLWSPKLPKDIDPQYAAYCGKESVKHLNNFLSVLNHAFWLDGPEEVDRAHNKLLQMEEAEKAGIQMPETLVSNHPERIRQFFHQVNGNMVMKMQTVLSVSMNGSGPSFRTSKIQLEDLESLQSAQLCPMIFQEEIPKVAEYRVVFVDGLFYCGKIIAESLASNSPDIKSNSKVTWEIGQLPELLMKKITIMMKNLHLQFGVMDILETPSGEFVFLEVNPVGEWGMLEKELNLPISRAIAETLKRKIRNYEKDTHYNASERQPQH